MADPQENREFTLKQIEKWNYAADFFGKKFPSVKYFHASASGGLSYSSKIKANVMRLGIGLYGIKTSESDPNILPALEMASVVSSLKTAQAGEFIGYGLTHKFTRETRIATIPAGYNEGIDRRLSNKGFVKIGDRFAPVIGRISMNITAVDVTDMPGVKYGDRVSIVSANPQDKNSAAGIAKACGTIPYEILVHIPEKLRRTVTE